MLTFKPVFIPGPTTIASFEINLLVANATLLVICGTTEQIIAPSTLFSLIGSMSIII